MAKKTTARVGQFCQVNGGAVKNGSVSFQRLQSKSLAFHGRRDLFASMFPVFLIKRMPRV